MDSYIISDRARAELAAQIAQGGEGVNTDYVSVVTGVKPTDYVADSGLAIGSYPVAEGVVQKVKWNDVTGEWDDFGPVFATVGGLKFDNVADVRSRAGGIDGQPAQLLGYTTPGDGGHGPIFWDADSEEDDNGGTIFKVAGVDVGRWKRPDHGFVNVKWFEDSDSAYDYINSNPAIGVISSNQIIGPADREDQLPSPLSPRGPRIRRALYTTEDLSLFVDPVAGNDSNDGTQANPYQTINKALEQVPRWIYHKVRIYLLDGDYSGQDAIIAYNYFISPRSTAGFAIIGHIASVDGEAHPVYVDTDLSAVTVSGAPECIIGGIAGSEEFTLAGFTIDGRVQIYDAFLRAIEMRHINGAGSGNVLVSAHYGTAVFSTCTFENAGQLYQANDMTRFHFQNCTATNINSANGGSGKLGVAANQCIVSFETSYSLFDNSEFNPDTATDSMLIGNNSMVYGRNYIRRGQNDELLFLGGHTGSSGSQVFGGSIALIGEDSPSTPGDLRAYFGGENVNPASARFLVIHQSDTEKVTCIESLPGGDGTIIRGFVRSTSRGSVGDVDETVTGWMDNGSKNYRIKIKPTGESAKTINVVNFKSVNDGDSLQPIRSGLTASRPAHNDIPTGYMYFDIDLGKPIWSDGTNWVDATGTTV